MANSFNRRNFMKATGLGIAAFAAGTSQTRQAQAAFRPEKPVNIYGGEYDSLKVGLCQIHTEEWAIEDNLKRTLVAIEAAAAKGAEVAVTPECVLHGYGNNKSPGAEKRLWEISERLDGKNLQLVCQKARQLGIYVLIGFIERGDHKKLYNSVAVISREGKIIDVYRKVHCRRFERFDYEGFFTPGDRFFTFGIEAASRTFKVGVMICFDREVSESARCLRALGAEIILCLNACPVSDMTKYVNIMNNDTVTRCRAAENELFIALVNLQGRFNGRSFVVGPKGELLYQCSTDPEVQVIDIPVGVVRKKLRDIPLRWMGWGYRRPEIYKKYL